MCWLFCGWSVDWDLITTGIMISFCIPSTVLAARCALFLRRRRVSVLVIMAGQILFPAVIAKDICGYSLRLRWVLILLCIATAANIRWYPEASSLASDTIRATYMVGVARRSGLGADVCGIICRIVRAGVGKLCIFRGSSRVGLGRRRRRSGVGRVSRREVCVW